MILSIRAMLMLSMDSPSAPAVILPGEAAMFL